jgi:hypothetical protein
MSFHAWSVVYVPTFFEQVLLLNFQKLILTPLPPALPPVPVFKCLFYYVFHAARVWQLEPVNVYIFILQEPLKKKKAYQAPRQPLSLQRPLPNSPKEHTKTFQRKVGWG